MGRPGSARPGRVGDPELVVATIARAAGLQSTDETTASALAAYLRPRTTLLILDHHDQAAFRSRTRIAVWAVQHGLSPSRPD